MPRCFLLTFKMTTSLRAPWCCLMLNLPVSRPCIDSTVRAAADYGFDCVLASDACAASDLFISGENISAHHVHLTFMAALSGVFARIQTVQAILAAVR